MLAGCITAHPHVAWQAAAWCLGKVRAIRVLGTDSTLSPLGDDIGLRVKCQARAGHGLAIVDKASKSMMARGAFQYAKARRMLSKSP